MKTSEIGGIVLNHLYFLKRNAAAAFEFLLFSVKNKTCGKDLWAIETFLHMKKSDSPIKKSHDKNKMQFLCFGLKNYASLLNCRRLQFSTPEKTLRRDKLNVMFLYKSAIEIGDVSGKNVCLEKIDRTLIFYVSHGSKIAKGIISLLFLHCHNNISQRCVILAF